ncbi:uncharacterized protein LOC123520261 [Portunus trituberculatus]|uniref:uncharacterized protein LOC123520261 n=1 Tax=Portunus trituberculatus TaxID=210409 RepID=UPI001E1CEFA3|nr:uncharacterized protein LOC123520261 [Portunus trituberculatus]
MLRGGVAAACVVAVVIASTVTGSSLPHTELSTSPVSSPNTLEHRSTTSSTTSVTTGENQRNSSQSEVAEERKSRQDVRSIFGQPGGEDLNLSPAQIKALRKLLLTPDMSLNVTVNTSGDGRNLGEEVRWQCFLEWLRTHSYKARKDPRTCNGEQQSGIMKGKGNKECMPVLLLVVPALCNGTQSCVNLTETSIEELLHRYVVYERKRKRQEEADDAVIYIVVVLAFYSFGIVFMIANFVRQEQRELEETKMYKQYVKLARDRWLTTRGNMANKLALQALNTFNAIPQTTDVNKVTFV